MLAQKSISFLLGVLMMIGVFAFVGIAAQELEETSTGSEQTESVDRVTEIKQRVEERKENRKLELEQSRQELIVRKCKGVQTKIALHQNRANQASVNRLASYNGIISKLTSLVTRMTEAGIDTSEVTTLLENLDGMVVEVGNSIDGYQQTLSDLVDMDCAEDPEGFQASLESAREEGVELKEAVKALHGHIRTSVHDAFEAIRISLSSEEDTGQNQADEASEQAQEEAEE